MQSENVDQKRRLSRRIEDPLDFIMIRFRLRERMADMSFRLNTRVTLEAVADSTGIHRATLSKIGSQRGCNTTTDNLDKLCRFFGCSLAELAEYVPDEDVHHDAD